MIAFTEQIAIQNARYGIRANAILPGLMDTPMAVDTRARHTGKSPRRWPPSATPRCRWARRGHRLGRGQRGAVPGQRRGRLHHRRRPAGRRRAAGADRLSGSPTEDAFLPSAAHLRGHGRRRGGAARPGQDQRHAVSTASWAISPSVWGDAHRFGPCRAAPGRRAPAPVPGDPAARHRPDARRHQQQNSETTWNSGAAAPVPQRGSAGTTDASPQRRPQPGSSAPSDSLSPRAARNSAVRRLPGAPREADAAQRQRHPLERSARRLRPALQRHAPGRRIGPAPEPARRSRASARRQQAVHTFHQYRRGHRPSAAHRPSPSLG